MGKDFLSNINSIKMPGEYPISKYRKVIKKADPAQESEIRVRVNSPPFAYAAYAGKLLLQKDFDYVYLNATGAAVSNSIKVIEYLKTHIKGLHISYNILSKEFVDEYEPKVEGLDKVTTTRTVSTLEAKLTIKKGEELAKEVGYMAPSANEDDIDQKGFEDSMAKYNERKTTKQDGGDRRGGDRRGGDRRGGDRRPRTQSGKYNDNEERKEGGNGGERRTNNYDNREGGDRRRYNNDNRDGGDRRRNDNRDGGDRRNDNRDVKRYDNRDNRDNRNRDNYNKDNNRDEKRYDNRDNRDNRNRDNYTKTDNYQKDDRRTDDRRDGGDNRRGGDRRDGGDRNYDNRRREDGDNRGGRGRGGDRGGRGRGGDRGGRGRGDRRENDNRNENYQKDYKNDRD